MNYLLALLCWSASLVVQAQDMSSLWQKNLSKPPLAVGATFAPDGRLWQAKVQQGQIELWVAAGIDLPFVKVGTVNDQPETIAADGENRPQLAFSRQGQLIVAWTQSLTTPFAGQIRYRVSSDNGQSFGPEWSLNDDQQAISHRFVAIASGVKGVKAIWLDARDKAAKKDFVGSSVYSADFDEKTGRFGRNVRLAEHSCECCQLALATNPQGEFFALWRHVYPDHIRDHAMLKLDSQSTPQRVTFDQWQIRACPHHGPSLAISGNATLHLVWFNGGRKDVLSYGRMLATEHSPSSVSPLGTANRQRMQPAVAATGNKVAVIWKEFDGEKTRVMLQTSTDDGQTFSASSELFSSPLNNARPLLLTHQGRIFALWNVPDQQLYRQEVL